ncbi:MAG TPA: polyprenyl diphosphate synthase [Clostridia bacterium]|nr:polyprenyl diphosphate synthase [Clostridia bacterium]
MNNLPNHIAFIMDGNGRWANMRGMPRAYGHKKGVETVERVINHCLQTGIKFVSLYVFSTENWKRPNEEVNGLFELAKKYFAKLTDFRKKNIKIVVSGERNGLPAELVKEIAQAEKETLINTAMTVNLCINYGGRTEIVSAVNNAIANKEKKIDEETLSKYMYHNMPDPDIIIRTGGHMRLSNFLLYQSAYSELFFTDTLWPDYSTKDIDDVLEIYSKRQRNYGGI